MLLDSSPVEACGQIFGVVDERSKRIKMRENKTMGNNRQVEEEGPRWLIFQRETVAGIGFSSPTTPKGHKVHQ